MPGRLELLLKKKGRVRVRGGLRVAKLWLQGYE